MLQELENDTGTWSWRRSSAAGTTSTQVPNLVDVPARRPGRPEGEPVGTAILPHSTTPGDQLRSPGVVECCKN